MGENLLKKTKDSNAAFARAQMRDIKKTSRCLYSKADIESAMDQLAEAITQSMKESNPVVLVVMTGGLIFAGHLLTRLDFPLQLDYIHATRYQGKTSGGELHWLVDPKIDLNGRSVLILDDILDEGHTLVSIRERCESLGAIEVQSAVLIEKRHDRKYPGAHADFVGLQVDDYYIFGYGLDYHEYWRNADAIYAVDDV